MQKTKKDQAGAIDMLQLNDITRAAVILNLSRRKVVQLIQEQKIAHTRIGRKIFVTNQALKEFVAQNTVSAI